MHSLILPYLTLWKPVSYCLVALGMIIEGDLILFSAAFLLYQGYFAPIQLLLAAGGGLLVGEIFWYQLGAFAAVSRFPLVNHWIERLTARFDSHLERYTARTLFFSKFMYGFGHIMIMRAGMLGLSPRRFIKKDALATLAWALIVGALGYFSAASFLAGHYLRFTEEALVVALLFFLFFESIVRWISENLL